MWLHNPYLLRVATRGEWMWLSKPYLLGVHIDGSIQCGYISSAFTIPCWMEFDMAIQPLPSPWKSEFNVATYTVLCRGPHSTRKLIRL